MILLLRIALLSLGVFACGCDRSISPGEKVPLDSGDVEGTVLTVAVFRNGSVEIDGERTPMEGVSAKIATMSESRKQIYYYREGGQEEPHPNAMKVISAAMDAGLPIMMSADPDFSTYVDEDGNVHKRK